MAEKVLDRGSDAGKHEPSESLNRMGAIRVCEAIGKGAAAFRRRCPVVAATLGVVVACSGLSCALPLSAVADDEQVVTDAIMAFASKGSSGSASSNDGSAKGEGASGKTELESRVLYASMDEGEAAAGENAADAGGDGESAADEAEAEDLPDYSSMSLTKLKREVEDKTKEREETSALLDSLTRQSSIVRERLDEATAKLAEHQALAERSVRDRYKVQRQYPTLIDALLCAQDWESFIAGIEYIESASEASVTSVTKYRKEAAHYEKEQIRVEREKAGAERDLNQVTRELEAATSARDEAQRKADLLSDSRLQPDGANWKAGKRKFIAEWGPRIDNYLEGSPMAGLGETFAQAAWENHVDPRFSPAISFTESGKGAVCIRPHNAWGWGAAEPNPAGNAAEWATWEDAINAHVKGLANGYGYTISKKGAKRYCPPNWQLWYSRTVEQMNSI